MLQQLDTAIGEYGGDWHPILRSKSAPLPPSFPPQRPAWTSIFNVNKADETAAYPQPEASFFVGYFRGDFHGHWTGQQSQLRPTSAPQIPHPFPQTPQIVRLNLPAEIVRTLIALPFLRDDPSSRHPGVSRIRPLPSRIKNMYPMFHPSATSVYFLPENGLGWIEGPLRQPASAQGYSAHNVPVSFTQSDDQTQSLDLARSPARPYFDNLGIETRRLPMTPSAEIVVPAYATSPLTPTAPPFVPAGIQAQAPARTSEEPAQRRTRPVDEDEQEDEEFIPNILE